MELNFNEKFILLGFRNFYSFFTSNEYINKGVSYNVREGVFINFVSYDKKRDICIAYVKDNNSNFHIGFSRHIFLNKWKSFSLLDIFKSFPEYSNISLEITYDNMQEKMELCFEFIKKHLMPIIRGDIWIDELLRSKNIPLFK